MKFPEHVAVSYLLAQFGVQQEYGTAGTVLVIVAGCLPDLDGISILAGWRAHRKYHRVVGHGLPVTLFGPALLALLGFSSLHPGEILPLWLWLQAALLIHLATDVIFYRWPAQLLWPVSSRAWGLGRIAWNDLVPTFVLYSSALIALCWPSLAVVAAGLGCAGLLLYVIWRMIWPRSREGWAAWLTGDWVFEAAPVWRWLTGDFIT